MRMPLLAAVLVALGVPVLSTGAHADDVLRSLGATQGLSVQQQKEAAARRAKAAEHRMLLKRLRALRAGDTRSVAEKRQEALDGMRRVLRRDTRSRSPIAGNRR